MKKTVYGLVGLLSLCGATHALAENLTTEFKVTGKLTPGSCTIALANQGDVSYGNIYDIAQLGYHKLVDAVTVTCDGATVIGVSTTDNRAATVASTVAVIPGNMDYAGTNINGMTATPNNRLGLGTSAGGQNIGMYSGSFTQLKADGKAAKFSTCQSEDMLTGGVTEGDGALWVGACPAGQSHQVIDDKGASLSAETFVWDYMTNAVISSDYDPTEAFDLDGSITVQVNYL